MQPTNPSRRRLLAGLFAGLCGWLSCGNRSPVAQASPAVPPADSPSPIGESVLWYSYDDEGNLTSVGLRPPRPLAQTVYTYDARSRVSSVTHR